MSFLIYDIVLLIVFTLAVGIFLYRNRSKLQRQGLLYLYRTKVGINFIDKFTKKYSNLLRKSEWLVITSGYILMVTVVYFIIRVAYLYLSSPTIARELKVPVLLPLIPYLPELFQIDFLPSFPFTYWIIIIALIAIPHEFAHGIYARLHKLKIHATGFGFLGPFLAAFVEPDEKQLEKTKIKPQLAILAAGTFANILTSIVVGVLMLGFFAVAFTPAGVNFNSYATSIVNITDADIFYVDNMAKITLEDNSTFYTSQQLLEQAQSQNVDLIYAFDDTPAFRERLTGPIIEINGEKVTSFESLRTEISKYQPGETIEVKTLNATSVRDYDAQVVTHNLTLAERDGQPYIGIGISQPNQGGIIGGMVSLFSSVKDPFVHYESSLGDFGWFIYNLLWWSFVILISVALVNMLPVGMFDGGRFFYLSVLALTKSKKIAEFAFRWSTWIMLLIVAAMMAKWFLIFL